MIFIEKEEQLNNTLPFPRLVIGRSDYYKFWL